MHYNVPATAKKHSDGYKEFFTSPGLVCLIKDFLEFFDMDTKSASQKHHVKR